MTTDLRDARVRLSAVETLQGSAFGRALATKLDEALIAGASVLDGVSSWALVALGSYARRELCPASDVDVMLLHDTRRGKPSAAITDGAAALWYPLWDAGFSLGQSVRSVREAIDLADSDLHALTALLDVRLLAGSEVLVADLASRAVTLAGRRRARLLDDLRSASAERHDRPGPVAEMLEPNVKDGAGGLRDVQSLGWMGAALDAPDAADVHGGNWERGVDTLATRGYLTHADVVALTRARERLLRVRVALHRVTGRRGDQLALQEHDAVARALRDPDADRMVRDLAQAARAVTWIVSDVYDRLAAVERGPNGYGPGVRELGNGVLLRDGRAAIAGEVPLTARAVLELAGAAAQRKVRIERATLERLGELEDVQWDDATREAFFDLLGAGWGILDVFESLDHAGVLERLIPEWPSVRAYPQRNAYHRFTVDRHLLETIAETAALLDPDAPQGADFDGEVARAAPRELVFMGALLHDIGKSQAGDHSEVGAHAARVVAARMGLDPTRIEQLAWLVEHHLLLADTATRRDVSDEGTYRRYAEIVGDVDLLRALYVLTIADSRATGPAAWSHAKAALVRELHSRASQVLEAGAHDAVVIADRRAVAEARYAHLLVQPGVALEWSHSDDGLLALALAAPDRPGLLATVAGSLAVAGFDIRSAAAFTGESGRALEVFTGVDTFGRFDDPSRRESAERSLVHAIEGAGFDAALRERALRYRRRAVVPGARDVRIVVDNDASERATVIEVHAPDEVGLLARVASVFTDLDLDVSLALVSTLGDRVVDVFYLRDGRGEKVSTRLAVERLRATLMARLTSEVTLDERPT